MPKPQRTDLDRIFNPTPLERLQDFVTEHKFLVAIIAGLLAAGGEFIWQRRAERLHREAEVAARYEAAAKAEAEAEHKRKLQEWLDLPRPSNPAIGERPVLPPIPDVEVDATGRINVSKRLDYLIDTNPNRPVAEAMRKGLDDGSFGVEFVLMDDVPASFKAGPPPTMEVNPRIVHATDTPERVLIFLLVLNHEWEHYKQLLAARDPDEVATFTDNNATTTVMQTRQCEFLYSHETQAYREECRLALSWGMTDYMDGLCTYLSDDAAFRQRWFKASLEDEGTKERVSECYPTWARLAGHPHPEAYE